ncbi:hypothetical protein YS110_00090 [Acidovorax sp. YS12]|nr:hypothetical protein YS110_00090 [Acidovorax sp. YS12]
MSEYLNQFFATDKDIFDLLASAKQKLTENVLREIARERGIFYSPNDSREDLADALSLLPFTLNELVGLMDRRETSRRNEKTTTIILDATIESDDIKAAIKEYQEEVGPTEKVDSHLKGANEVVLNVEYDEMDYSRTRLIQRQRHDATIQFVQQNGKTLVRLPASEKSLRIVENLTSRIESHRKAVVPRETIELDPDFGADERTAFFTRLMSELPGYKLKGVTNLRISPSKRSDTETDDDEDLDDDEREAASREMLVIVRSMALTGENLMASEEYQALRKRGFFITAITWRADQTSIPYDAPHLHAEFADGEAGTGFKYSVKGIYRFQEGFYTKTARPADDAEREKLYGLLEATARKVLSEQRMARVQTASSTGAGSS